jgi:hypothetical protein
MLWQVAAATVIGFLFYIKRVAVWARNHLGLKSERVMGFVFATIFALVASPATISVFTAHPLPRFNDVFLVGIVLAAYLFTWDSAAYLLTISLMVSAWVLPPAGTLWVQEYADWYRLASFAGLAVFLICLITRMKTRVSPAVERERPFAMSRVAAGAD